MDWLNFRRREDLSKLRGWENEWRLRVGDWRVRFQVDRTNHIIVVLRVLRRSQAYHR